MSEHSEHHEGHHHKIEVKITYEDEFGVVAAEASDSVGSVKARGLVALEIAGDAKDYEFFHHGHAITNEDEPLKALLREDHERHIELHLKKRHHTIKYFVNDEPETTTQHKLAEGFILENAGFKPMTDYKLQREKPFHDYGRNYDELVEIHDCDHFRAVYNGPVPTS